MHSASDPFTPKSKVGFAWRPAVLVWVVAAVVVVLRLTLAFHGDVLGFYRIGTIRPHSPYLNVSPAVQAPGELGYDGQLYLAIALDPGLSHPATRAALDNPRFRYRRILFPLLGYVLSLGRRNAVPWLLVFFNIVAFGALAGLVGGVVGAENRNEWEGLFVLGIPGYWCAMMLTTADLLAAVGLTLALALLRSRRVPWAAVAYALASLSHETMLLAVGAMAVPLVVMRRVRDACTFFAGAIPALLWNAWVLFYLPPHGSSWGVRESFGLPAAGILAKLQAILSGPVTLKWLYDSATFLLMATTLGALAVAALRQRWADEISGCAAAYVALFLFARMHILSYYLDFLRVFGPAVLLLVLLPHGRLRLWFRTAASVAWCAASGALVGAFLLQLI